MWCNKGRGMCYSVCGMMHIKEPLLLIGKSSPCGGSGFPLSLFYNLVDFTAFRLSASLNKTFPSLLSWPQYSTCQWLMTYIVCSGRIVDASHNIPCDQKCPKVRITQPYPVYIIYMKITSSCFVWLIFGGPVIMSARTSG